MFVIVVMFPHYFKESWSPHNRRGAATGSRESGGYPREPEGQPRQTALPEVCPH